MTLKLDDIPDHDVAPDGAEKTAALKDLNPSSGRRAMLRGMALGAATIGAVALNVSAGVGPRKAHAENAAIASLDAQSYVIEAPSIDDEEIDAFNPVIIAEATKSLRRFSVSEAVMELDLTGAPVVVFVHGTSGRVNVIYRRQDGNIGWVDPSAVNS